MKKIMFIIIPIVLIATIWIIVFINRDAKDDNILAQNVSPNVDSSNETSEDGEVNSNEELVDYWVNTYEFPKETKPFSISLFDGFITPPIKLTDLENKCDYLIYHDFGKHKIKKFSEIKKTLDAGSKLNVFLYMNDDSFAEISSITIENFSEESKTAQECIENGWWCIRNEFGSNSNAANELLGIDLWESDITVDDEGIYILEEIINKLGKPTKIIPFTSLERKENIGVGTYDIVYQYSDFVLDILVFEQVYFKSNNYGQCTVKSVNYFTPNSWEYALENNNEKGNLLK